MREGQKEQTSSLAPKAKAQTDGKIHSIGREAEFRAEIPLKEIVRIRHAICGTLPRSPAKRSKKSGGKGSVVMFKGLLCLKILLRENLFYVKKENWDQIAPSTSPKARGSTSEFGKERVQGEASLRSVNLMSAVFAHPSLRRGPHDETWHQEKRARRAPWELAKSVCQLKKIRTKPRSTRLPKLGQRPAPTPTSPNERELVVDSGASMQMLSKEDLSSAVLETLRKSMIPTTVVTANGEVQTTEEAQVYVHDLDLLTWKNSAKDTDIPSSGPAVNSHG